jgi:DNA-directed RNA polymerase subunit M/transcription elongation factor TFIIS
MMSALKKKETPSLLGKSLWRQKQRTLFFFGYLDGKEATENQHHLPSPLEGMTFYGDILVVASSSPASYTPAINLKTAEYETFYTSNLEGEDSDTDADATEEDEELVDNVNGDEGVEEDDEQVLESEDESDASSVEEIKPVRATRVRKTVVAQAEHPEVEADSSADSSPYRTRCIETIATLLPMITEEVRTKIEAAIFKKAMDTATFEEIRKTWNSQAFRDVYLAVSRRIVGNLDPASYIKNKNLWIRFSTGELTIDDIVRQNYYELCPENWQQMVDRQAKREQIQLEGDFSRATDKWMCHGCKQRKCTYYELQTRSADEPMTIFIHCLNCNKRWTQ